MLWQSRPSSASAAIYADVEQRMRGLEKQLDRLSTMMGRTSAGMTRSAGDFGEAVVTALGEVADRFRHRARNVGDDAAHFGTEAAKFGNDALRRLSSEVEHRPLLTLAIAVGVGFLVGMAARHD
jgi:ElaB/YqjD/DUF883 family membrane-anchored ribosome-binding protein